MKEMELLQECLEVAARQCDSIAAEVAVQKTLNFILDELKSLREDVNKILENARMIK